jgi:uncharacterized membrane protein YccF (DUF307 family)
MRTLGNIIWHFPFFGFLNALFTFIVGGLFVITVVGAPIGLGLIQLSKMYMSPFSSAMVSKSDLQAKQNSLWKIFGAIVRIVYFPFGLFLCAITVLQIAGLFITLVGIPVALVLAKSLGTYFNPVGKVCVSTTVRDEMERRKAKEQLDRYANPTSSKPALFEVKLTSNEWIARGINEGWLTKG